MRRRMKKKSRNEIFNLRNEIMCMFTWKYQSQRTYLINHIEAAKKIEKRREKSKRKISPRNIPENQWNEASMAEAYG